MQKQTNNNDERKNNTYSKLMSKEEYHRFKLQEQIDKYEEMLDWMYGTNHEKIHTKDKASTNSKH